MELLEKTDPAVTAQLFALWKTVFGDAYIRLVFDLAFPDCRCFLKAENGRAVSALYLLDCAVKVDDVPFGGYYLYAAATDPAFRRMGFMAALIEEAKAALWDSGQAFIALVPANDPLYSYYERFGFRTAMYLYEGIACADTAAAPCDEADYYEARAALDDAFHWTRGNFDYAMACLAYEGVSPYRTADGVLLRSADAAQELLLEESGGDPLPARSPYPFPGAVKRRFGMIFTENDALRSALAERQLYMNLALD